jgi:hypothetical protein
MCGKFWGFCENVFKLYFYSLLDSRKLRRFGLFSCHNFPILQINQSKQVLALNRCIELISPYAADVLFGGRRIFLWIFGCSLYGIFCSTFLPPVLFSSVIFAWPFDPFIGYPQSNPDKFSVPLHIFHDSAVAICSPLIYFLFIVAMRIKTHSFGLGNQMTRAEKMVNYSIN